MIVENIKGEVVPMPMHNTMKTYTKWTWSQGKKNILHDDDDDHDDHQHPWSLHDETANIWIYDIFKNLNDITDISQNFT